MIHPNQDKIIILDCGSQYTALIARRIRELNIFCEIFSCITDIKNINSKNVKGIILSGGPDSVQKKSHIKISAKIFQLGIPILGICYGMQIIANHFHCKVVSDNYSEFGKSYIHLIHESILFNEIPKTYQIWMSHTDKILKINKDFQILARTNNSPIAAFQHKKYPFFGVQYHPEVTHSHYGKNIFKNFALLICKCNNNWNTKNIITNAITSIQKTVKNNYVILAISGGLDSSVVAMILKQAIDKKLICIFVDTGLLRLNEANNTINFFLNDLKIKVICIDAKKRFLTVLKNLVTPEKKRKVIGELFVKIFEEEAAKIKNIQYLAQGTVYSDIIESAKPSYNNDKNNTSVIKTHHNVGGLPIDLRFTLIEPLKNLFKDEVYKIGYEIGLPLFILKKHPFPGPGLAVRIIGKVRKKYLDILRKADDIYIQELKNKKIYNEISQAFTVFLPIKSVGVMGDKRYYNNVIAIRAIKTVDFMTADFYPLPYDLIEKVSNRIINEIKGISRVVYDVTSKPPSTIEWE